MEDDYDSEFRYDGIPVSSLRELDGEHVIYVGTFSKTLFPSLRLGYLVLPAALVASCKEYKRLADHHSNSVYQLALVRFIESGNLERHIRRMKAVYAQRRDSLSKLLSRLFPDQIHIYGKAVGMHFVAGFDGAAFTPQIIEHIRDGGVYLVPVEQHAIMQGMHLNQVILGYAHLNPEQMEQGLLVIQNIISG